MSDDKLDLKLNLDVDVHDAEKAKALREELARIDAELTAIARHTNDSMKAIGAMAKAATGMRARSSAGDAGSRAAVEGERDLYAELKKRFVFERRMSSQRKAEESEAARAAREESRAAEERFREQLRFNTSMNRQRERETRERESAERQEILATAKMKDRAARDSIRLANEVRRAEERAHEQAKARIVQGVGQVRAGAGRAVVGAGAAGIGAAYLGERAIDALTRSGVNLDKAVNANIRLSGLDPKAAAAKGQNLARKSAPIARSLGLKTAEYLQGRAEALQAGVDESIVDAVTEFGSKYAKLNDMSASEVLESSGYGITALSSFGKVGIDQVKQLFNKQQYLAATTAASRQGLAAFVRRGLSAGASAGFNLDDTLAYGGAATSSGADGEMAARMLSSTTERIASMPTRMADIARKKHKTIKDRTLLNLPKKLGFGSWKDLKTSFSADSAGVIEKIYEGLAEITDPRERLEASEEIFGREFGSVHSAMAVGHRFRDMRRAVRSKEAGNAIDSGMAIKSGSFDFIMDQIGATIQSLKDGLGMVLKPFWADLRDWALKAPAAFDSFDDAFRSGLMGLLQGLGSSDGSMSGLLKSWLGDPGSFRANARAVGDFARGVGQGLKATAETIKTFFSTFAGADASAETIGRLSARFMSLSVACLALAPVVGVIGGITGLIAGIVNIARAAATLGGVGAGAGAAIGAGALASVAKFLSRGFIIALAAEIGAHRGEIVTAMFEAVRPLWEAIRDGLRKALSIKGLKAGAGAIIDEIVPAPLKRWWDGDNKPETPKSEAREWVDPPIRKPVEKLTESIDKMKEAVEDQAKVQKQSYQSEEFRSLIQKASISTIGSTITAGIRDGAARVASPLSGSVGNGGGGALATSTPGGALPGTGLGRNGIIGGSGSGSRSFRNSNPGNLKDGPFARRNGATGRDKDGFAIFPDEATGRKAQEALLFQSDSYKNLSIRDAIKRYAPGSDGNDPNGYAAEMAKAAGVGVDTRMGDLTPEQRAKFLDAQKRREGWKAGSSGSAVAAGSAGGAVDTLSQYLGQNEYRDRLSLSKFVGHDVAGNVNAWCARAVNTSLASVGIKGTGSATANSFYNWGFGVDPKQVARGDVLLDPHGRGPNQQGGHVGLATGQTRVNPRTGRFEIERIAGNEGDAVRKTWVDADKLRVRRATDSITATARAAAQSGASVAQRAAEEAKSWQDIGEGMRTTGFKPVQGPDLGQNIPPTHSLGNSTPLRSAPVSPNGTGAGGGQPAMTVTNHFHGNGQNHEELANAVQRKLGDDMRRRSHDLDYGYG